MAGMVVKMYYETGEEESGAKIKTDVVMRM